MKEIKQPYIKHYPVVKLFTEDIEQLIDLFKQNFSEYELIVDKYQLNNLSDITTIKKVKTDHLRIKHHRFYKEETPNRSELIDLELKSDEIWLYVSNKRDTFLLGVASQIDMILSKKKVVNALRSEQVLPSNMSN